MKAVIETGGKQYVVSKGDKLDVEILGDSKTVSFDALLVTDDKSTKVGTPNVNGATVKAKVLEADKVGDKVTSIRYKAKKRVHKRRGHRQHYSTIEITDISSK